MMNVSEYANDVGKKVSEILKLCQTLDIKVSNEEDMLSDDDIIMLDNEIANLDEEEEVEQLEEEIEDFADSYEEELEEIYEKLQLIYEEAQEYEKVWEISREAVEVLPDSERLWMNYLERYCENPEMERELCAEAVKKAIQAVPELAESEAFKQLQGKYKIVIDGENIRVGE